MSERDDASRRVRRLLSGQFGPRDVDRLFMYLRFNSYGLHLVRDIGDFAGHIEDRDRGASHGGVNHFAAMATYMMSFVNWHSSGGLTLPTVESFKASVRGAFEVSTDAKIFALTKFSKPQAKKLLERALAKVVFIGADGIRSRPALTLRERKILDTFQTRLGVGPLFLDDDLARELGECLVKNSLIGHAEVSAIQSLKDYLSVYAVERMHLGRVKLQDGRSISLKASTNSGYLEVAVELSSIIGHSSSSLLSVFRSQAAAERWCHPSIAFLMSFGQMNAPLEIGDDWRLRALS